MRECNRVIDLGRPVRSERVRGFQPPWRTVFVYRCECGAERRVRAGSFLGSRAVPGVGGIYCGAILPECVSPEARQVEAHKSFRSLRFLVTYARATMPGEAEPVAAFACKGDAVAFADRLADTPIVRETGGRVAVTDRRTAVTEWSVVA